MSKKGINIHKRGDGRWEGRYKSDISDSGVIKMVSVYGKTYAETKEKLLAAMSKASPPSHQTERTFSEILKLWLRNNGIRQKGATEYKYRTVVERHIEPELGPLKVSCITAVTINAFLERKLKNGRLDQKGELSASYVRTMSLIIQSAMQLAVQEQLCQPLKSPICKPVPGKKDLQILSKEEQKQLESYSFFHCDRVSIGVMISLYAGLRIGEICALSWEDIDLNSRVIHIRHTIARVPNRDPGTDTATDLVIDTPKTAASVRNIPIAPVLMPYLMEMKRKGASGFLVSETPGFLSPRTYEYRFHRMLSRCGIRKINYHTLRHTFATRCIEAGVDVKSLSEMLGHANVGITLSTYVHSSMEMKQKQLEKLHA